ncbi:hypothetical protein PoB_000035200 [Plakobranchus ocellatus]|uniref:Uncharacterized protein n=1 Tax=Plakobranchus ocellatus TaxID=259542 RepID=A0AAV3XT73_9GAST|nr:hypothetical protein PoB_000035200 [Plakobranchus ocellatus]
MNWLQKSPAGFRAISKKQQNQCLQLNAKWTVRKMMSLFDCHDRVPSDQIYEERAVQISKKTLLWRLKKTAKNSHNQSCNEVSLFDIEEKDSKHDTIKNTPDSVFKSCYVRSLMSSSFCLQFGWGSEWS